MPRLLIKEGQQKPYVVTIAKFPFRVGREPDNDLVLNDEAVSGYHFRLLKKDAYYYVEDLGSRNGTFLNKSAARVHSAAIDDGTYIGVGRNTAMRFRTVDTGVPHTQLLAAQPEIAGDHLHNLTRSFNTVVERIEMRTQAAPTATAKARLEDLAGSVLEAKAELADVAKTYARLASLYDATGYIISGIADLDDCLRKVLDSAMQVLQAERGFLMLRDPESGNLEVKVQRALTAGSSEGRASMGIAEQVARTGEAVLTTDAGREFGTRESVVLQDIRSALCVPLHLQSEGERQNIGVLYMDVRGEGQAFRPDDKELLTAFGRLSAIAIQNARLFQKATHEERLRNQLARNLPEQMVDVLIDAGEEWGPGGDDQHVTILSSDIRGFTTLSETMAPQQTLELLNYYFSEMTEVVFTYDGTLDKFIGDGLMAIFGAPYSKGDDAVRAAKCAIAMVRRMHAINEELPRRGFPRFGIGIALHSGVAVVGNIGSARRMDYTAVGDTVNVAFRVAGVARPDIARGEYGQILLTESTFREVKDAIKVVSIGEHSLKGKQQTQSLYRVVMPATTVATGARPAGAS